MNRSFFCGLASAGLGLVAGIAYRMVIQSSGHCAALFGVTDPQQPCSTSQSWVAFLNVFAIVTLAGSLLCGIVLALHARDTADGYVGLGDTFLAIGTLISLVEVVVFVVFGGYMGIAYGVIAVALTLFALKQDRQTSMAVAAIMALFCLTWVMSDADAIMLGTVPSLMWIFACGAYVASLKSGEQIAEYA